MGDVVDLESFRYSGSECEPTTKPSKRTNRKRTTFLRGPIPMGWLASASKIPRRNAIVVGLVLWHLAGLQNNHLALVLCVNRCKPFGLGRKSVERGLRDLESAGLIKVDRGSGRCPRVNLLKISR